MKKIFSIILIVILCTGCFFACAESDLWICPGCGFENTTNFCTQCGTKKPETITCPGCGEKYPIDTTFIFCGNCGTKLLQEAVAFSNRYEGSGFDTPEDAVMNYLEGLKELNLTKILQSFAIETRAEKQTLTNTLYWRRTYDPMIIPQFPEDESGLLNDLNTELIKDEIITALTRSMFLYLHPDYEDYNGLTVSLKEDADIEAFVNGYNLDALADFAMIDLNTVTYVSPDTLTNGKYSYEANQKSREKMRIMYGADELTDLAAVFTIGNVRYVVFPGLARYDDKWYIYRLNGQLSMILGNDNYHLAFKKGE